METEYAQYAKPTSDKRVTLRLPPHDLARLRIMAGGSRQISRFLATLIDKEWERRGRRKRKLAK